MASPSGSSPCAACKFLRRKCTAECVFAPYFPPDQPHKFASVHKIFGASNITKLLNDLPPHQREDAVNSLAYEADARVKDPVYGCVGAISLLQRQIAHLQHELALVHSDLARLTSEVTTTQALAIGPSLLNPMPISAMQQPQQHAGQCSSTLGIGMGLALPPNTLVQSIATDEMMSAAGAAPRDQMISMRDYQARVQMVTRDAQFAELQRETQLTREQLIEHITRAGGGSFEAGLAAFGMGGGPNIHAGTLLGPTNYPPRSGSGGSGSSGGGGGMSISHLSPP